MTTRDPRLDPRAGDEIVSDKAFRKVIRVRLGDPSEAFPYRARDITYTSDKRKGEQNCWISTWQAWCEKNSAKVVTISTEE